MSSTDRKQSEDSSLRLSDVIVILLCLSGAVLSIFMFYRDLYMSLRSSSAMQAGTVIVRHNIVQRRLGDRVIWDRLFEESVIYDGDYIRIANLSSATLNVDENNIKLDENTMVRIKKKDGVTTIDTFSGKLNITSNEDSGKIQLTIGDRVVETSKGASFSASSGKDGIELHITEGTVLVTQGGITNELPAGTVIAQDTQGNEVFTESFVAEEKVVVQRLLYPPDYFTIEEGQLSDLTFTWETSLPYDRRFQISARQDFSALEIDESVRDYFYRDISISAGVWYWRIVSKQDSLSQAVPTDARRFTVTPSSATETTAPVQEVRAEPPAPASAPPQPALFPAPGNRLPATGYRIDAEQLRQKREIVFSWSAVRGANAYIITIFSGASPSRTQIFQTNPITGLKYTFSNLEILNNNGTFFWQIEAVYYRNGRIERRGRYGENSLVLDVPRPGRVQTKDVGILYGTE